MSVDSPVDLGYDSTGTHYCLVPNLVSDFNTNQISSAGLVQYIFPAYPTRIYYCTKLSERLVDSDRRSVQERDKNDVLLTEEKKLN